MEKSPKQNYLSKQNSQQLKLLILRLWFYRFTIVKMEYVHVTHLLLILVLLPEECRWLMDSPNRFWFGELKLRALRRAFAFRFNRELKKAEARSGAGSAA